MALTANTLPSTVPDFVVPFDANMAFNTAPETLSATGYLGSSKQLDIGPGRVLGLWALDISAMTMAADESYKLHLLGSNDPDWGNGNVELLAFEDFAYASSGRQIATILGASNAVPPTGRAGLMCAVPFTNLRAGIVYRYLRAYLVAAGTTKNIKLMSWVSPLDC
ncbi:hypothetical protein [Afipia carboxidovorans]|uniref:hypothetical protein n=1 Tax=Afipia carboxidovorans TaxID=40137 RepID=UPI00308743C5|nr:hypothetical protein CRBSH125_05990 [Afipia carboxidovorans]